VSDEIEHKDVILAKKLCFFWEFIKDLGLQTMASVFLVMFTVMICAFSRENAKLKLEAEAVSHGYARYVPDGDKQPKFEWIAPGNGKEK